MGRIAIIGLGLIGGSMGLALKRAEPVDTEVVGYDKDVDVGVRALKAGAIQTLARSLEEAVRDSNLLVVATPIISARKVLEDMAPYLKPGAVVTDTLSTKTQVLRWARQSLPAGVSFVGGHPMAGKESSGVQAAEESLFDGRPYCIVPSTDAAAGAVSAVVAVAQSIGAKPFFLDAEEHDAYAAAVSHVPLVASVALFNLARGSAAWPELAMMAGPGFHDLTRLASGDPGLGQDIAVTNRANLLHWLERYMGELRRLADLIDSEEGETLFRALAETQFERDKFLESPPERQAPGSDVDIPSAQESMMDFVAGRLWRERAKEVTDAMAERNRERERVRRLRRQE
jgi:prephenate dehydrogenase